MCFKKMSRDFCDSGYLMILVFNNILGKGGMFYLNILNKGEVLGDFY